MDHALRQAKAEADDQLTMFINSSITLEMESNRGELKESAVVFDANGVPTEESVRKYVDNIMESSKQKGSDTMIGRSTVCEKVIKHHSGHDLAVVVRLWSFDKYDAMKRIIEKPKDPPPQPPVKSINPVGPAGNRRGRSYDF